MTTVVAIPQCLLETVDAPMFPAFVALQAAYGGVPLPPTPEQFALVMKYIAYILDDWLYPKAIKGWARWLRRSVYNATIRTSNVVRVPEVLLTHPRSAHYHTLAGHQALTGGVPIPIPERDFVVFLEFTTDVYWEHLFRKKEIRKAAGRFGDELYKAACRSPVHALEKVKCADDPAHLLKDDDCASATTVTE